LSLVLRLARQKRHPEEVRGVGVASGGVDVALAPGLGVRALLFLAIGSAVIIASRSC